MLMYPNKKLTTPCVPVTKFGGADTLHLEKVAHILHTSLFSMPWGSHLGIAANQIGRKEKMAIVLGRVVVNPEWQPSKAPKNEVLEGCYSLGMETMFKVPRAPYGWAKWQDTKGEHHEEKLSGIKAVVYQHEVDHLEGRTCHESGVKVEPPAEVISQLKKNHGINKGVQESQPKGKQAEESEEGEEVV
jgi:peptide deformylase